MKPAIYHREIFPTVRVLSESEGLVEYVASDQTLDSYREIILANGWKFDARFRSNPVFLDSHSYWGIADLLGKVTDWRIENDQLIQVVKWAIDVPENKLAQLGFQMTAKGYLKAVSVGFIPVRMAHRGDDDFTMAADSIKGLSGDHRDQLRTIYLEQQQIELSACVIGANPAALAKAYRAGDVKEELMSKCGFTDAESFEVLDVAARVFETSDNEAVRDMARLHLRACTSQRFHPGNQSKPASSASGNRSAAEDPGKRSGETKAWMKEVAEKLNL